MAKLNERNEKTKKVIHLLVTSLCNRDCKYCCNKQYDINDIPYVTDEELRECETLCLTGGEPFKYANPNEIALYYKNKYENIKNVYVYTGIEPLIDYLIHKNKTTSIDGINISIKNKMDAIVFDFFAMTDNSLEIENKKSRLYIYDDVIVINTKGYEVIHRTWQEDFVPADDSIFRKI